MVATPPKTHVGVMTRDNYFSIYCQRGGKVVLISNNGGPCCNGSDRQWKVSNYHIHIHKYN